MADFIEQWYSQHWRFLLNEWHSHSAMADIEWRSAFTTKNLKILILDTSDCRPAPKHGCGRELGFDRMSLYLVYAPCIQDVRDLYIYVFTTFAAHLILQRGNGSEVCRANVACVSEVHRLTDHWPVNSRSPPPLFLFLLRHARKQLDPKFSRHFLSEIQQKLLYLPRSIRIYTLLSTGWHNSLQSSTERGTSEGLVAWDRFSNLNYPCEYIAK